MNTLRHIGILLIAAAMTQPSLGGTPLSGTGLAEEVAQAAENVGTTEDGKTVYKLPYSQSFDNENEDYDGTGYLPVGWLSTGSAPFITAGLTTLPAVSGEYYMIAPPNPGARDDRAYTAFFQMNAGTTYTLAFHLCMPGYMEDGELLTNDFQFTIGTEQDAEFHTPLLTLNSVNLTQWTRQEVEFTPEADGLYCFSFALSGEDEDVGYACIDDFTITYPGAIWPPKPNFSYGGIFNLMDSHLVLFGNNALTLNNLSENADEYEWSVPGATPETSSEPSPTFTFSAPGTYTATLTARNGAGEKSFSQDISVSLIEQSESLPVMGYNPMQDAVLNQGLPYTFDTDPQHDFITGVNHYYRDLAERFALPQGQEYTISSVSLYLLNYMLMSTYSESEASRKLSIAVYGEKDGRPDTRQVFGRYDTTLGETLGKSGIFAPEMRSISLPQPITANGPFYVAFEFDPDMPIDSPDPNITRTYICLGGVVHQNKVSSLFVRPTAVPEEAAVTPDGDYHPIDEVSASAKGHGLNFVLWGSTDRLTGIALAPAGNIAFAVKATGNGLTVSGTCPGETVRVYNTAGQMVASAKATAQTTTLSTADLPKGIYVVTAGGRSQKFANN